MLDKQQTPEAVREAVDPRVEIGARALGLHRIPGGEGRYDPPTRWPSSPRDTLSGRDGTVPLTWEFAEQCRAEVRAILAALDSRAGDAGEVEEQAEDWLDARAAPDHSRDRDYGADDMIDAYIAGRSATPAPAVDAVPAGEVEAREHLIETACAMYPKLYPHAIRHAIEHDQQVMAMTPAAIVKAMVSFAALSHGEGRK